MSAGFVVHTWSAKTKSWRIGTRVFAVRDSAQRYAALVVAAGGHAQAKELAAVAAERDERQLDLFEPVKERALDESALEGSPT
jgi:hypothetical protein